MSERCSKIVPGAGWYRHDCSRKATVERDGKWWCWQHDPEYVAEKRRKEEEKWEVDSKKRSANWARERRAYAALDALEAAGITNPEAVGDVVGELKNILWLIDEGQLIEAEPSHCGPLMVGNARAALAALESDG